MKELFKVDTSLPAENIAKELGLFLIRAFVCLFLCGAAIFIFSSPIKEDAWIPQNGFIDARIIAVAVFIAGALILFGLFTYQTAIATGFLIIIIVAEHLFVNPFYNFSIQLFPLLLSVTAIIYLCRDYNKISLNRIMGFERKAENAEANSWIVFLLRVFLGLIFLAQGANDIIKVGVINFAQKVYVAPFAESWLPQILLWIAGVLNPPVQLIGGIALILGFKTKLASLGIAVFLVSIIFGHIIQSPFEDIHDFSIANFITVLLILFLEPEGNRYSLDYFLRKRGV